MTERLVKYLQHLLHSSTLYPAVTLWLFVCAVVPMTWAHWITHGEAVVFLGIVTLVLVLIADKRDARREMAAVAAELKLETQAVSAELSGKVAEVHNQLTEALKDSGLDVPPPENEET